MPLVKAQCTNCGGILEVDNAKEAAICPYCNTPYIVEKAINCFITNITVTGDSIEQMLLDADTMLNRLHDLSSAEKKYSEIVNKFPSDYRGHLGLGDVYSNNRTVFSDSALRCYKNAVAVAPAEKRLELQDFCSRYEDGCLLGNEIYKKELDRKLSALSPAKRLAMLFAGLTLLITGVLGVLVLLIEIGFNGDSGLLIFLALIMAIVGIALTCYAVKDVKREENDNEELSKMRAAIEEIRKDL